MVATAAILAEKIRAVGANSEKKLYANPITENHNFFSVAICNIVAMSAAILKKQVHELGSIVKKIPYAKTRTEIQKIKVWLAGIFNIAAILKIKSMKTISSQRGRILLC